MTEHEPSLGGDELDFLAPDPSPTAEPTVGPDPYYPEPSDRDIVLRHATEYLRDVDQARFTQEQAPTSWREAILDRFSRAYQAVSGRGPRAEKQKLEEAYQQAADKDAWEKATGIKKNEKGELKRDLTNLKEGMLNFKKDRPSFLERLGGVKQREQPAEPDQKSVERLARYREALDYRDKAIKLIQERNWADNTRQLEIDRELNSYYMWLMKLAHTDSYNVLYEYEHRVLSGKREDPSQPRPAVNDFRLSDVRILHTDQTAVPNPEAFTVPEKPGERGQHFEAQDLTTISGTILPDRATFGQWVETKRQAEQQEHYPTNLDKPAIISPQPEARIGSLEFRNIFSTNYQLLTKAASMLTAKGLENNYKIKISEQKPAKAYSFTEPRRDQREKPTQDKTSTKSITFSRPDPTGQYTEVLDFTLYSDGFVIDGKRADQPRNQEDRRKENLSIKLTRTFVPSKPGLDRRPTEIIIDPADAAEFNKHGGAWDELQRLVTTIQAEHPELQAAPYGLPNTASPTSQLRQTEVASSPELSQQKILEQLKARLVEAGLPLSEVHWNELIGHIHVRDLANDLISQEVASRYANITPIAVVSPVDNIIRLDLRFEQLTPEQQSYILSHELGHKICWGLINGEDERITTLRQRLQPIEGRQISGYIEHLESTLPLEDKDRDWKLEQERLAELSAQYMMGGGSFPGFMKVKLQQLANPDSSVLTQEWIEASSRFAEQAVSWDNFFDENNLSSLTAQQAFFTPYPGLAEQYAVFQDLRVIMTDPAAFDTVIEEGDSGYETCDDIIMIENWHDLESESEPVIIEEQLPTRPKNKIRPADFLSFRQRFS